MFTLRQYLLSLSDSRGLTHTLGEVELCRDGQGRPRYSVGNSAVVFRIRRDGRTRSLRCYLRTMRHLREIYGDKLLEKELYLYTSSETGVWVDVVLGDWIEGVTLHEAAIGAALARDTAKLRDLAESFDTLAAEMVADDCAHGHAHRNPDGHAYGDADRNADGYPDGDADRNTDGHPDGYAHGDADRISDAYADSDTHSGSLSS